MSIRVPFRKFLRQTAITAIGPFVWASLVLYFAYYAIYGDRGLMAMRQLQNEVEQAKAQLDDVHKERVRLENRTALLRPDNLDRDMLDERARLMLNYSHPDDVVIILPQRAELPTTAKDHDGQ
jgi:cell division protein FtsB